MEFHRFCTLLVLQLQPSNDAHQGFALAFHRRDAPGLSTLLIKENQSGPDETLCTVFAYPCSRHQIQDALLCCAIGVVIRRRDSQGSSTIFSFAAKKDPLVLDFQRVLHPTRSRRSAHALLICTNARQGSRCSIGVGTERIRPVVRFSAGSRALGTNPSLFRLNLLLL